MKEYKIGIIVGSALTLENYVRVLKEYVKEHCQIVMVDNQTAQEIQEKNTSNFKEFYKIDNCFYVDPIIQEKILEDKREISHRARQKQWTGKQFKQKNNRRQNRIAYNHGKHRKK